MHITRRQLLAATGALIAAPALVGLSGGRAYAQTTLTLGHGAAPGNPRTVAAAKFAELVAAKTEGRVIINVAGSETLGSDSAMLTSLRTGALDFTANSQGATSALLPELNILGLPFAFQDADTAYRVVDGPVGETLTTKFEALGVVSLGFWDNGIRHVTNSKKAVATPADIAGLKIRTPADPMTTDIFAALGCATEQIAFGELYIALQQGVVDGQENPLANIASSKLFEVNPFISLTAHKWECNPFLMSSIARGRVGADFEHIVAAANEARDLQRELSKQAAVDVLAEFRANADLTVTEVDRAAFVEATKGVADAWRAKPEGGSLVDEVLAAAQG